MTPKSHGGQQRTSWAYLVEAVVGDVLQDDGLHGEHVGKLHLWDVQSADDMGPPWGSKHLLVTKAQKGMILCPGGLPSPRGSV